MVLPDIKEMNIDKDTFSELWSKKKSHICSISEASMIRLSRNSLPTLSAVEISNIWAYFY